MRIEAFINANILITLCQEDSSLKSGNPYTHQPLILGGQKDKKV